MNRMMAASAQANPVTAIRWIFAARAADNVM